MSSTFREMRTFLLHSVSHPRFWGIFLVMIALFSFIGPFGTFESLEFPARAAYWSITMIGSWFIAILTIAIVMGLFIQRWNRPFALMMIGTGLASFPIALYLHTVVNWFLYLPSTLGYWYQLSYAAPISLTFGMLVYFALSDDFSPDDEKDEAANLLQERLSPEKRGPVLHMSMQDHYVSVTTTRGSELVLMRMADAVAALTQEDGLQIHRSHWVAKSAVKSSKRENGQPFVILQDGTELPVSRSFSKATRDAGVI